MSYGVLPFGGNSFLRRQGLERITDLTFENTEFVKENEEGKSVRLDVTVFTTLGERINVEIQIEHQQDMPERTLYYWSRMFSSSLNSGESYYQLPPTIVISILNRPLFPSETDRFHTVFHLGSFLKLFCFLRDKPSILTMFR